MTRTKPAKSPKSPAPKARKRTVRTKRAKPARVEQPRVQATEAPDPRQLTIPGAGPIASAPRRNRNVLCIYASAESLAAIEKIRADLTTVFWRPSASEIVLRATELGLPLLVARVTRLAKDTLSANAQG